MKNDIRANVYSSLPLVNTREVSMSKGNSVLTYDPLRLKSDLFSAGGSSLYTDLSSSRNIVFHINRIEDYKRTVKAPVEWEEDANPYRLTIFNFFFLTNGSSTRSKGLNKYNFSENTFFFIPAHEITAHHCTNEQAEGWYCHFHLDLLTSDFRLKDLLDEFPFLNLNCHPLVTISPEMRKVVLPLYERLEEEYKKGDGCRHAILRIYLMALFTEIKPFASSPSSNYTSKNSAYHITEQYKKTLSQHIYEKQRVGDYADLLAVSPNHLNKCVKCVTGKSAQEMLSEMLLLEAKVLLKQTTLAISEIAFQLGWSEISAFTRCFKSKTGVTPGDYRKMNSPDTDHLKAVNKEQHNLC